MFVNLRVVLLLHRDIVIGLLVLLGSILMLKRGCLLLLVIVLLHRNLLLECDVCSLLLRKVLPHLFGSAGLCTTRLARSLSLHAVFRSTVGPRASGIHLALIEIDLILHGLVTNMASRLRRPDTLCGVRIRVSCTYFDEILNLDF